MPVTKRPANRRGQLRSVVTWLERSDPPALAGGHWPDGVTIEGAGSVSVDDYRAMYRKVGEAWLWWERLLMPDAALASILADPATEIRVLHLGDAFAGFSELNRSDARAVEIAYFGIASDQLRQGLGRALMDATLRAAWSGGAERVWLHTCTEDHPGALAFYESVGFRRTRSQTVWIDDPRLAGILPRAAAPHIPLAE